MRAKIVFAVVCIVVVVAALFFMPVRGGRVFDSILWSLHKPDINKAITTTDAMPSEHSAQVYGSLKMVDNFLILQSPGGPYYLLLGNKIKELGKYFTYSAPAIYVSGNMLLPKNMQIGNVKVAYAINVVDYDQSYYEFTRKGRESRPESKDAVEMKKKLFAEINESDLSLDVIRGQLLCAEYTKLAYKKSDKKSYVFILLTGDKTYILVDRSLPNRIKKIENRVLIKEAQVIITGRYSHPDPSIIVPQALEQHMFEVKNIYNDTADKDEYTPRE